MPATLKGFFDSLTGQSVYFNSKSYKVETVHDDYVTLRDPHPPGALDGQSATLHVPYSAIAGINDSTLKGTRTITLHTDARFA